MGSVALRIIPSVPGTMGAIAAEQGNEVGAIREMRLRLDADPVLREAFFAWALHALWRDAIRDERQQHWRDRPVGSGAAPDDTSGVVAHINRNLRTLYDFPLPGGKRLGDATAADLDLAISEYSRQARGMVKHVHWLSGVKSALGEAEHVRDAVPLDTLSALQRKAEAAAGALDA